MARSDVLADAGHYRVAAWSALQTLGPAVNIRPPRRFATNEQATSQRAPSHAAEWRRRRRNRHAIYAPSTRAVACVADRARTRRHANADIQLASSLVPSYTCAGHSQRNRAAAGRCNSCPRAGAVCDHRDSRSKADGSFDIAGIPAGSYILYRGRSGGVPIDVADGDVDVTIAESSLVKLRATSRSIAVCRPMSRFRRPRTC